MVESALMGPNIEAPSTAEIATRPVRVLQGGTWVQVGAVVMKEGDWMVPDAARHALAYGAFLEPRWSRLWRKWAMLSGRKMVSPVRPATIGLSVVGVVVGLSGCALLPHRPSDFPVAMSVTDGTLLLAWCGEDYAWSRLIVWASTDDDEAVRMLDTSGNIEFSEDNVLDVGALMESVSSASTAKLTRANHVTFDMRFVSESGDVGTFDPIFTMPSDPVSDLPEGSWLQDDRGRVTDELCTS